jgi:hypothetical protein
MHLYLKIRNLAAAAAVMLIVSTMTANAIVCNSISPDGCGSGGSGPPVGHLANPVASNYILQSPRNPTGIPWRGNTDATMRAQFPGAFLYTVQNNPSIDTNFAAMDDLTLATLSHEYYANSGGNVAPLLNVLATRLSAANMLRVRSAFGSAATGAAVAAHASLAVQAKYFSAPEVLPLLRSHSAYQAMGVTYTPSPQITMGLTDIYLEFYAVEGATYLSAAIMAASWASVFLAPVAYYSYKAGTQFSHFLDHVDPNINIEIGNALGTTLDFITGVSTPSIPTGTATIDWNAVVQGATIGFTDTSYDFVAD